MEFDLWFLDYIWNGISVLTLSTTIFLGAGIGLDLLIKNSIRNRQRKWHLNIHSVLLTVIILVCFICTVTDPELVSACFTDFAKRSGSFVVTRFIAGLYLTTVSGLVLMDFILVVISSVRLHKGLREATIELTTLVKEIQKKIHLTSRIKIAVSDFEGTPFVWGLFRYRLVVPAWVLRESSLEGLEAVLAHELMHIKEKDSFWLLITHVCKRLIFFHPLAHFVSRLHRLTVEMTADEMAVSHGSVRPSKISECLVKMASRQSWLTSLPIKINASRGFAGLKLRICALASPKKNATGSWKSFGFAIVFLVASAAFALPQNPRLPTIGAGAKESPLSRCSQINHEKMISDWLAFELKQKKCEKDNPIESFNGTCHARTWEER